MLSVAAIVISVRLLNSGEKENKKVLKAVIPGILIMTAAYIMGLLFTYLFKFTLEEAVLLASFKRYINIILYAVYYAALLVFARLVIGYKRKGYAIIAVAAMVMLIPLGRVGEFVRKDFLNSGDITANETALAEKVLSATKDGRIYYVKQKGNGLDHIVMHYKLRPNTMEDYPGIYFGEPRFGDLEYRDVSAEDWMAELWEGYDYLALSTIDDYFVEKYSVLFDESSPPEENAVYKIEKGELLKRVK